MPSVTRRLLLQTAVGSLATPALSQAQTWPDHPIRCIVPLPPGGGTDVLARTATRRLAEALGVPIVVDNRPGAGGIIGTEAIARAAPDGYTIGIGSTSTLPVAPILRKDVPYDPVTSFEPITLLGTTPYVLIGGPAAKAKDLAGFIAAAKQGDMRYASVGVSTLGYLLTRQFEEITGLKMVHVPYRGSSQAYPDLVNGTVAVLLDNPPGSAGLIEAGTLTAFAVTRPSALLPGVPTFKSLGVQDFDSAFWYGLVAPPGTPPAITGRMREALAGYFLQDPGLSEMRAMDVEPAMSTPADFGRTIAADARFWREAATRLNIQPE
jgi:tripartite-type tricarboxylate transporter receptor subunit TctC